jgi:hypothetical protein
MLAVLQLFLLPRTISTELFQTITIIQSYIKVKAFLLGKSDGSDEKSYLHFLSQMISTVCLITTQALNRPV